MTLPILYSYRRCPYAMRARMALRYAGVEVETLEITLREKPAHMLAISPKGTVPVLQLSSGEVLEQSLDIMRWALSQRDNEAWLGADKELTDALIQENDTSFKSVLDCYKYPDRYPEHTQISYREQGEVFLTKLELLLEANSFLLSHQVSLADIAIFPFIRQFAAVDVAWFELAPYPKLRAWLHGLTASELFIDIMQKVQTYQE